MINWPTFFCFYLKTRLMELNRGNANRISLSNGCSVATVWSCSWDLVSGLIDSKYFLCSNCFGRYSAVLVICFWKRYCQIDLLMSSNCLLLVPPTPNLFSVWSKDRSLDIYQKPQVLKQKIQCTPAHWNFLQWFSHNQRVVQENNLTSFWSSRQIGIYSCFVKILGPGPRPKQRQRNSERYPDHINLTSY